MKQVLQNLRSGATSVVDVPCPQVGGAQVLVETSRTLVSIGTERMLVEFGRAGWIEKARQQPDKVRMVLDKIKTDGLAPTLEAVRNKLDQPLTLGYCNVGKVVAIGDSVLGFEVDDRVISNGKHAEFVSVPMNLCAKVPDGVSDDEAAFTVLGAVALQGIRLAQPTLGESVVVIGLGLLGLLAVQLLRAQGCRVLGVDLDARKLQLAQQFGAEVVNVAAGEDPVAAALRFSRGRGVDAVLITASTQSSEPVHQAALMSRKRGRIVLVGVTGLELSRADFYEKELTFQVSCSYGPGRYDPNYEEKGQDYPLGFVRWTEQRNFEAFLDMLAERKIDVQPLISHRFAVEDAPKAYDIIAGSEPALGVLLAYTEQGERSRAARARTVQIISERPSGATGVALGFIGAGNYASAVLVPAFARTGARLHTVSSASGVTGVHAARKFGFAQATSDVGVILGNSEIGAVVVATRHDSHARYVLQARAAGKHVFVEKPLCLTLEELASIEDSYAGASPMLMVGFNRRFAAHVRRIKELLAGVRGPKVFIMTVNAGAIPAAHWTQDLQQGGGRIVGEACHFIDLLRHLAGVPIVGYGIEAMLDRPVDTVTISLRFEDGTIGTIHYLSNGSKRFPKERLEIFASGHVLQLDNFRRLVGFGWRGFKNMKLWRQDKGQQVCAQAFVDAVRANSPPPIPLNEIFEVARVSIDLQQQLR